MKWVVNSDDLPDSDRSELEQLLKSADFFNSPQHIRAPPGAADIFHFKIMVADGARAHSIDVDQTVMPEQLKPLMQWLRARARPAGQ